MRSSVRGSPVPRFRTIPFRCVLLAASCLLGLPLPAVELVMRDLQADTTVRPTSFDFTLDTPTFTRSGSDAFDAGTGLELGGRYSLSRVGDPFGLILGLDATAEAYRYDSHDFMTTYGLRGSLGAGYAFNDDWTVTADLGLSYGMTDLSLPASDIAPELTADGTYLGYDLRVAALYGITRRMLISLQVGYLSVSHDLTTNQDHDLTLDLKGLYVGVGMTWRFSRAPERVE